MLGVRVPEVRRIVHMAAKEFLDLFSPDDAGSSAGSGGGTAVVAATVRELWDNSSAREDRRAAIALLTAPAVRGWITPELMGLIKHMCITGAWWDLVDDLVKVQPIIAAVDPAGEGSRMREWAIDLDMWTRRYAILSQLGLKKRTDTKLLSDVLSANIQPTDPPSMAGEFFIRKAIGWALRDYSVVDAGWVEEYVGKHGGLSALSRREALRRIDRRH